LLTVSEGARHGTFNAERPAVLLQILLQNSQMQQQQQKQQRDWDEESSLGRTTLSSYKGAITLANTPRSDTAFELLYTARLRVYRL